MSISTLQTRFIPASGLRSRLLLDLIGNHRICSPTGKRATNLGLVAVLNRDYSDGSYRVLYLKNTKKIKSFPSNLSHAVVRKRFIDLNEALKRFYRSSNAELQMRKRDEEDTQDLVEAPHPKEGQLSVGQKGHLSKNLMICNTPLNNSSTFLRLKFYLFYFDTCLVLILSLETNL